MGWLDNAAFRYYCNTIQYWSVNYLSDCSAYTSQIWLEAASAILNEQGKLLSLIHGSEYEWTRIENSSNVCLIINRYNLDICPDMFPLWTYFGLLAFELEASTKQQTRLQQVLVHASENNHEYYRNMSRNVQDPMRNSIKLKISTEERYQ